MIIVRVLLGIAITTIIGALALYVVKRDRRYLRFIGQIAKFTIIALAVVMVWFVIERVSGVHG